MKVTREGRRGHCIVIRLMIDEAFELGEWLALDGNDPVLARAILREVDALTEDELES